MKIGALLMISCLPVVGIATAKPKKLKVPTQPTVEKGCVTITDIYSHKLGILSGVTAPEPGLEAVIRNGCPQTVMLTVTIGYFDSAGSQFGNGYFNATVASGTNFPFNHAAVFVNDLDRGRLRQAKIIAVLVVQIRN